MVVGYRVICIENRMNASAFRNIWARVMFSSSQNCTSRRRVQFENLKTSRETIYHEMHERSYNFFIYNHKNYHFLACD